MRVTSHLNLQALFLLQKFGKNRKFHLRQQEKIVNVYEFFTERNSNVFHRFTPFTEHRGGYENDTASPADTGRRTERKQHEAKILIGRSP